MLPKKQLIILAFILISAFVIRIILASLGIYHIDLLTYQLWSLDLVRHGFGKFYQIAHADYPPGYFYILWLCGKVYYWLVVHLPNLASMEVIYKLPSILADIGNALFIFLIAKGYTNFKKAILLSLFFLFNPAFIFNSTIWGQIDSFVIFFLISSFYFLLKGKLLLSAILLAFGQATKPIVLISLPIYIVYLLYSKKPQKNILFFCLFFLISTILIYLPFNNEQNIFLFIIKNYQIASGWFPYTTIGAFNFWAFISALKYGTIDRVLDKTLFLGLSYQSIGQLIFIILYSSSLFYMYRNFKTFKKPALLTSFTLAIGYILMFLFLTQIRDRHLFYGLSFLSLLMPVFSFRKNLIILFFNILYFYNLYFSFQLPSDNPIILPAMGFATLGLLNMVIWIYLMKIFMFSPGYDAK